MRPIHLVDLDKWRPAVILTREATRDHVHRITAAPITSRMWGLPTEVPVGVRNGIERDSVISLDNIKTVGRSAVGRQVGWLLDDQEPALARAIAYAFDLEFPDDW